MIMAHLPALPLGPVLALWNLALAVFSTVGAYHCMSGLIYNAMRNSWRYTVCTLPETIELHNTDMDLWAWSALPARHFRPPSRSPPHVLPSLLLTCACYQHQTEPDGPASTGSFFVLSKIAEFFDTILKVLMKKNFIFLHWYHHLATAYFCWLSVAYNYAPGLWIAALNFSVHAPMYTYYFLSSTLNKKWFTMICKPVAPLVTTLQISQMVTFTIVNVFAVTAPPHTLHSALSPYPTTRTCIYSPRILTLSLTPRQSRGSSTPSLEGRCSALHRSTRSGTTRAAKSARSLSSTSLQTPSWSSLTSCSSSSYSSCDPCLVPQSIDHLSHQCQQTFPIPDAWWRRKLARVD